MLCSKAPKPKTPRHQYGGSVSPTTYGISSEGAMRKATQSIPGPPKLGLDVRGVDVFYCFVFVHA